jgi:hypothetical protein
MGSLNPDNLLYKKTNHMQSLIYFIRYEAPFPGYHITIVRENPFVDLFTR